MKGLQKIGGYAAIIQGLLFVVLLLLFGSLVSQNFVPPADYNDPAKVAKAAPIIALINWVIVFFSGSVVLVTLAVYDRLHDRAPDRMRLAVAATLVASPLFLAEGLAVISGAPLLGGDRSAGIAFNAVTQGLLNGAQFAASWSALLWGWVVIAREGLPKLLAYLVVLGGLLGLVGAIFGLPPILLFIVNAAWSLWLGWLLLREPAPMAAPSAKPA